MFGLKEWENERQGSETRRYMTRSYERGYTVRINFIPSIKGMN